VSDNSEERCFLRKVPVGEARRGSIPAAVCDRGATKPTGRFWENPKGGGDKTAEECFEVVEAVLAHGAQASSPRGDPGAPEGEVGSLHETSIYTCPMLDVQLKLHP